jgi:hypothetical protein
LSAFYITGCGFLSLQCVEGIQYFSNQILSLVSYTALYNDSALHSLPAVINTVSLAVLRSAGNTVAKIKTYSHPWRVPHKVHTDFQQFYSGALVMGMAYILVACFSPPAIVQENQVCENLRKLLNLVVGTCSLPTTQQGWNKGCGGGCGVALIQNANKSNDAHSGKHLFSSQAFH